MAYSNADVSGWINNYTSKFPNDWQGVYNAAKQYNVGAPQIEQSMGWNPGTVNQWTSQHNLSPLPGSTGYNNPYSRPTTSPWPMQWGGGQTPWSTGTTGTNGPYPGADFSNAAYNGLNAPLWNPNIQSAMDATVTNAGNQFLQNVSPALDSQAIAAGGYGGDRAGIAKGVAAANAASQIAPTIANMNLQGFNSGADRQLAAGQLGLQGVLGLGGLDLQSQIAQNQYDIGLRNAQTNAASAALGNRYFGSPLAAGIGGGITLAQLISMLGGG